MRDGLRPQPAEDATRHGEGRILILGSARSGTTWLAKLFDSHSDVLYRHEPDIVHRPHCLPKSITRSEEDAYVDVAREYLNTLAAVRTLKTAGPLPVFAKRHRSILGRALRTGYILGVRGLEMTARNSQKLSELAIPDLVSRGYQGETTIVIKSVSLLSYARLFAKAWPKGRIVIIVRHPCGQVASFMRGIELGKLAATPFSEAAKSNEAERLGLRIEQYSSLSTVEQLAWQWAFSNEIMAQNIAGLNNVKVIGYEDLAADPSNVARHLIEFAGLSWNAEVERFIRNSTQHNGTRFYSLKRNPLQAANRWRETLSADDQHRISAMVSRVSIGRTFLAPSARRTHLSIEEPALPVSRELTS
jgi:hypothetical protein